MNTINDRIVQLIEAKQLKKIEFAEKLHISQAYVSQMCSGTRVPGERTIADICREFNVNRLWLETGEGPMLRPEPAADTLAGAIADIIGHDDPLAVAVMASLAQMPPNWWEAWRERLMESLPPELCCDERGEPVQGGRRPIGFVGYPDDRKAKKEEGNGV